MDNTISLIIQELHERYRSCDEGALADYIPELTKANPDWFGISVFTADGHAYEIGETKEEFTIQSISKAFTYGMILDEHGIGAVEKRIGVEPSGEAFNSISLDPETGRPLNPMINAGAIASTGMVSGKGFKNRFETIRKRFSKFAARDLGVDEEVYSSESSTGFRNRAIANLLRNFEMLDDPVDEAVEVYFKQCSILVNCHDLSVMAACLANGGINPLTKERVLDQGNVEKVLSVMSTCGMYDYSGEWIFTVGLPAKSGVGGGVMGVLPGQLGVAVFSPKLDAKGNSVRGVKVFAELSKKFNLHLFNLPVISEQVIRRTYKLSQAGSQNSRPQAHHDAIREHGDTVTIIELQGDVFFSALERVVRSSAEHAETTDIFVLDLNRAGMFDPATADLLTEVAGRLSEAGKRLLIVDHFQKLDRGSFSADLQVEFYDQIGFALKACEEEIIKKHAETSMVAGLIPFYEFDLFSELSPSEISDIEGMLGMAASEKGDRIITEGDDPDDIYFLSKGEISIYQQGTHEFGKGRLVTTFGPGACFGDIAALTGAKRSADVWADERVTCYTLPVKSFRELETSQPTLYIKLLRGILMLNVNRLRRRDREVAALNSG
ncbi:MAG: glutaminase A [Verrucomicrobiales bacterium]|nr:glutaminase A [Verrucomicrobiales bacterium]